MVRQKFNIINESEKNRILDLYDIKKQKEFVFDFVLTENNKYLIIADNVFVNGGNGKSIGSIWEHTYIFNEIINESLSKISSLNEDIKKEITDSITNIEWNKNLVNEWIQDKTTVLHEDWYNNWNDFKSSVKNVGSSILSGVKWVSQQAMNVAGQIFKQGVLPFLRWVRRGLYTNIGIVVDVVVSILAVKTNAIVWFVIVLLDIYEIITGDYDPQDAERQQLPFFFLIADLLGCVFTGAVALGFKKSAQVVAKKGLAKGAPTMVKLIEKLAEKIPSMKSTLKGVAETLSKKMGSSSIGIISKILGGIDKVLDKLLTFISKLFSKQGVKAVVTGGVVAGSGKVIEKGINTFDPNGNIGKKVFAMDRKLKNTFNTPKAIVDPESTAAIDKMAKEMGLY